MGQKIERSDSDFNTVQWREDYISIGRESRTHVSVSRHQHRNSRPQWSLSIDVTSGYRMLHVAYGNRLACVNREYLLAITCGEYRRGGSLHNFQLHYIHPDGQILWTRPWQTIQRFTLIGEKLLVVRYVSPPNFWIESAPLEAHLLDVETGESLSQQPIEIPADLLPHYQSWQVSELKTYLVWKDDELIVTVRPCFRPQYDDVHQLSNRGSFKTTLVFD